MHHIFLCQFLIGSFPHSILFFLKVEKSFICKKIASKFLNYLKFKFIVKNRENKTEVKELGCLPMC